MEIYMIRFALTVLIATSVCMAQTSTAPKPSSPAKSQSAPASQTSKTSAQTPASNKSASAAKPAEAAKEVPPTAPVVTLNNVCVKPDASGQCKTIITKAEFERLANSINPSNNGANQPLRPEAKRQIATRYSQYLAFADGAKKESLDQTPQAQELVHFATLQALAQVYMNHLQGKSTPTSEEITKYYNDNRGRFEKMTVRRILIPANPGPDAKNVTPESLKQTAQKIYERAKAGEDFDKLQKEAFTDAGISTAPDSKLVLNPAALPPQQQAVTKLKPGEISQPFTEVSGTYIYKMESSETTPLTAVKSDIEKVLQRQKFEESVKKMLDTLKPDLNESYFGPAPAQGAVPAERD